MPRSKSPGSVPPPEIDEPPLGADELSRVGGISMSPRPGLVAGGAGDQSGGGGVSDGCSLGSGCAKVTEDENVTTNPKAKTARTMTADAANKRLCLPVMIGGQVIVIASESGRAPDRE